MANTTLVFGTNNSQPVGTDNDYIEELYQRAYKPFIRTLYNAPEIRAVLHYSGHLLQWMARYHPEFTDVLAELSSRKQIELLGGGFYDPVLPLIPRADRLGQIEQMTTYLRKLFGRKPRGAWITEHVWEPSLPSLLKSSGMDYTFLDDYHFKSAGFRGEELLEPCLTEDEGKTVVVFPVCRELVDSLHRSSPQEFLWALQNKAAESEHAVISVILPGEELGARPETHERFFDEGWFSELFRLLSEERRHRRLSFTLPYRFAREHVPRRRGYFPPTSYREMMRRADAAPGAEDSGPFDVVSGDGARSENGQGGDGRAHGGFFRQFLTRYPESNRMYAKMHYTHILVNQLRGDKYRKQLAREELWKGQCHNAYWHARGGGIYHNRLRKTVYASLIEAEKVTREKGVFIPALMHLDFDMDGLPEYLYQGHHINAYVHLSGGVLFELDFLPIPWNYLDTFARHNDVAEASDPSAESSVGDSYARTGFIDHFLAPEATRGGFEDGDCRERGDFIHARYDVEEYQRNDHRLVLSRQGFVESGNGPVSVSLWKEYRFSSSAVTVRYRIHNQGSDVLRTVFAPELNLSLADASPELQRICTREGAESRLAREAAEETGGSGGSGAGSAGSRSGSGSPAASGSASGPVTGDDKTPPPRGEERRLERCAESETEGFIARDLKNNVNVGVSFDRPAQLWCMPVETVWQRSGEWERQYQSSCFLPHWYLELPAGETWETELVLTVARRAAEASGNPSQEASE